MCLLWACPVDTIQHAAFVPGFRSASRFYVSVLHCSWCQCLVPCHGLRLPHSGGTLHPPMGAWVIPPSGPCQQCCWEWRVFLAPHKKKGGAFLAPLGHLASGPDAPSPSCPHARSGSPSTSAVAIPIAPWPISSWAMSTTFVFSARTSVGSASPLASPRPQPGSSSQVPPPT